MDRRWPASLGTWAILFIRNETRKRRTQIENRPKDSSEKEASKPLLPEADRRLGQKNLIGMAVLGGVGDTFITAIAPLFLLALGSTPFYIGLLATTEHIQKIARVVGIKIVHKTGKARLMAASRALAVIPVVGLAALAAWSAPGAAAVILALVLIAGREFIRQTGNTVWWALIQDNTAGDAFGAFMAKLRIRQRSVSLVLPIAIGWYLGTAPAHSRFSWLFAIGVVTSLIAAYWALRISEGPPVAQEGGAFSQLRRSISSPGVAWLALFMASHQLIFAATGPMWVVALTDHGLGAMAFVWMGSVAALGQLVSLTWWGRLVDSHGPRSTLSITLLCKAALGFTWLILPSSPTALLAWSAFFYLAWGFLDGGQNMGRTRAMMDAVNEENQVAGFNAIMYSGSIGGIIGGVVGGWAFDRMTGSSASFQGVPISLVYLAGLQALTFVAYLFSRKLAGYKDQTSTRDLARGWSK